MGETGFLPAIQEGGRIRHKREMAWLTEGFGFDERLVHALLGQAAEYDMGNMFDPAYTMVCKISKSVLEGLTHTQ